MNADGVAEIIAASTFFGVTLISVFLYHWRKVMEMKLRSNQGTSDSVVAELRALKEQVNDLRDTTTRYDLSFDAALQRLESRMNQVEQRASLPTVETQRITQ